MADSNRPKRDDAAPSPAGSPDNRIKDLDVRITESDANSIVGGRKAGEPQPDILTIPPK